MVEFSTSRSASASHVAVAQQLLDGSDVVMAVQPVRRERVPQGVRAGPIGEPGVADGVLDGALDHGFVQVMSGTVARGWPDVRASRREHPLPSPVPAGVRVLALQRAGQLDPAGSPADVVPLVVEQDEAADPRHVRVLGAPTVVAGANGGPRTIEQPGFRGASGARLPDHELSHAGPSVSAIPGSHDAPGMIQRPNGSLSPAGATTTTARPAR